MLSNTAEYALGAVASPSATLLVTIFSLAIKPLKCWIEIFAQGDATPIEPCSIRSPD